MPFLNNLQALRAFAAANVVFFHLLQINSAQWQFGRYGVDLFFALSGFLMAGVMTTDPSNFLTRRLVRIVPLYWLCTLAVYGVASFKPQLLHSTHASVSNLVKSLFFVPYRKEDGLLQPMFFLGWTLNYEMYFYLICSVVVFSRPAFPILWVSLIVSATPACALIFSPASDVIQFYSDHIVFEFVLGMVVFWVFSRRHLRLERCRWEPWLLLLCLVALPCAELAEPWHHRWILLGLPAAGTVFAAASLERKGIAIRSRLILLVGSASYVLYLTHPYFVQAGEKFLHLGPQMSLPAKMARSILLAGAAVLFACALHVFFEAPLVQKLKRVFGPPKPLLTPSK